MAVTEWGRLVRESVRSLPSVPPDEGTALDAVLSLLNDGFSIRADGEQLRVTHPGGQKLTDDQRGRVAREKPMLLVLLKRFPEPVFPIDWMQAWRLEVDSLLRRAADSLPGPLRTEMLTLARKRVDDEAGWLDLGWQLMELEHRIRANDPDGKLPERATLVPWSGWVRIGGKKGEWERVEGIESDDWDECWRMLIRHAVDEDHVEKVVMPYGRLPGKLKGARQ